MSGATLSLQMDLSCKLLVDFTHDLCCSAINNRTRIETRCIGLINCKDEITGAAVPVLSGKMTSVGKGVQLNFRLPVQP